MTQQCLEPRNPMRHRHQTHTKCQRSFIYFAQEEEEKMGINFFTDLNRKKKKGGENVIREHIQIQSEKERERKYPRMKKSLQSDCGSVAQK